VFLLAGGHGPPDPASFALILGFWLTAAAFVLFFTWFNRGRVWFGGKTYRDVDAFLAAFAPRLGLTPERLRGDSDLGRARFSGTPDGRRAVVDFEKIQQGKSHSWNARLIVRGESLPGLVVTRETWLTGINKWLGFTTEIEVGAPAFDAKFLLQGGDRAKRSLSVAGVRERIENVFAASEGIESLQIESDRIVLILPTRQESRPERYALLLAGLGALARELERVAVPVRVLGGERRAFRGRATHARCAYCHEDVTGEEPDLVACRACATIAHDACWAELGRCPVMGCRETEPERGDSRNAGAVPGTDPGEKAS
jgi:hypothetical protein